MNEWAHLVDMYASELKKYQVVCSFCGAHLDETVINIACSKNPLVTNVKTYEPPTSFFTEEHPPRTTYATGRHFFARPSQETLK